LVDVEGPACIAQEFQAGREAEMTAEPEADFQVQGKALSVDIPVDFFLGEKESAGQGYKDAPGIKIGGEKEERGRGQPSCGFQRRPP